LHSVVFLVGCKSKRRNGRRMSFCTWLTHVQNHDPNGSNVYRGGPPLLVDDGLPFSNPKTKQHLFKSICSSYHTLPDCSEEKAQPLTDDGRRRSSEWSRCSNEGSAMLDWIQAIPIGLVYTACGGGVYKAFRLLPEAIFLFLLCCVRYGRLYFCRPG